MSVVVVPSVSVEDSVMVSSWGGAGGISRGGSGMGTSTGGVGSGRGSRRDGSISSRSPVSGFTRYGSSMESKSPSPKAGRALGMKEM